MEELDILPLKIFAFDLPESLLEDTLNKVKSLQWSENHSNQTSEESLNTKEDFSELHIFISECLKQVKDKLNLPFEKILLTQSWANKNKKGQNHHKHKHPNSLVSGVIFLTSHETGEIYFQKENFWMDNLFLGDKLISHQQKPIAGKVLIFPSQLYHGVKPLNENEERYSISFNSFPSGKIGFFSMGLELETKQYISTSKGSLSDFNAHHLNKIMGFNDPSKFKI